MNERPRYRRLDGAEVFESPIWAIVADVARSQPPLDRFFASYQRVIEGNQKPGDRFYMARRLIELFGIDGAFVLIELGRKDEHASWEWGISLFQREPPILNTLRRHPANDAKKFRNVKMAHRNWVIYNRVLDMIEGGSTLPEAYEAIAGTKPCAQNLGKESIEKIWKEKSRVVRETGERLVPQFGGGALVMQPGRQPKRGRRAKVTKVKV